MYVWNLHTYEYAVIHREIQRYRESSLVGDKVNTSVQAKYGFERYNDKHNNNNIKLR